MEDRFRISGLGLVASHQRKLRDGSAYNKFFPRPEKTDPFLSKQASVPETVVFCEKIVRSTLGDTKQISKLLKRGSLKETLQAIFNFYYNHVQYKHDKEGVEQLRRPARAWSDRGTSHSGGIDCDCFSISVSSVLTNLGIPHFFRVVELSNKGYYQHIYVVVPKTKGADMNIRSNYYVIDPVLDRFDLEAPKITTKKDHAMSIPVQYLNGVGDDSTSLLGEEFNGLGESLGCACGEGLQKDMTHRFHRHIKNTRDHIAKHPHMYKSLYKPEVLHGMYNELVGSMGNAQAFENKLEELSLRENDAISDRYKHLSGALHGADDELYTALYGVADAEMLSGFGGLGTAEVMEGLGRTKKKRNGLFTKLKNVGKAIKSKAGGFVKMAKKIGHNIIKFNPLLLAARAGFLVSMRTNLGRVASKAYWGYFSQAEAAKKGVTASYWKKAVQLKTQLETMFTKKMLGDSGVLKRAVLNGRAAKRIKGHGTSGLGIVVEATAVTASLPFLVKILQFVKGLFSKGNGKEETETGGEQAAASADPAIAKTQTDPGQIVSNDGAAAAAAAANKSNPAESDPIANETATARKQVISAGLDPSVVDEPADTSKKLSADAEPDAQPGGSDQSGDGTAKPGMSATTKVLIGAGVLAAAAGIAIAMKPKKGEEKKSGVSGVGRKKKTVKTVKLS